MWYHFLKKGLKFSTYIVLSDCCEPLEEKEGGPCPAQALSKKTSSSEMKKEKTILFFHAENIRQITVIHYFCSILLFDFRFTQTYSIFICIGQIDISSMTDLLIYGADKLIILAW